MAAGAEAWFWLIGVVATLIGATLTVFGLMLQKAAHSVEDDGLGSANNVAVEKAPATSVPYCCRLKWLAGLGVWLLGNSLCWVASGLAPQSLLACFNCWNVVVVFVLAPLRFGEAIAQGGVVSACLLVLGCLWTVLFGPKAYHHETATSLGEAWLNPVFICATIPSILFLVGTTLAATFRERGWDSLHPLHCTAAAAVLAWYAVILSKSTAMLTVTSIYEYENQISRWEFWAFVVALCICAGCLLHCLNVALKHGDSVVILPIYEAASMTGQIVLAGIFFDEFHNFSVWDCCWFFPGIALVLLGVACLARSVCVRTSKDDPSESTPLRTGGGIAAANAAADERSQRRSAEKQRAGPESQARRAGWENA